MIAYRFVREDGTSERQLEPVAIGETQRFDGHPAPCECGLHANPTPWDALAYAAGDWLEVVELGGEIVSHGNPVDKYAATERMVRARVNVERELRTFAVKEALLMIDLSDVPDAVREYLEDEAKGIDRSDIRDAAWSAAEDADDAAWDIWAAATTDAAEAAAWSAAKSAAGDVAWSAAEDAADAAEAAAKSAAGDVAWSAAEAAVRDAIRDRQCREFNALMIEAGGEMTHKKDFAAALARWERVRGPKRLHYEGGTWTAWVCARDGYSYGWDTDVLDGIEAGGSSALEAIAGVMARIPPGASLLWPTGGHRPSWQEAG